MESCLAEFGEEDLLFLETFFLCAATSSLVYMVQRFSLGFSLAELGEEEDVPRDLLLVRSYLLSGVHGPEV